MLPKKCHGILRLFELLHYLFILPMGIEYTNASGHTTS